MATQHYERKAMHYFKYKLNFASPWAIFRAIVYRLHGRQISKLKDVKTMEDKTPKLPWDQISKLHAELLHKHSRIQAKHIESIISYNKE